MTVVDVTGGVLGGCWQVTETVVKSSFLDSVQLVGQDGMSGIKEYKYINRDYLSYNHVPAYYLRIS